MSQPEEARISSIYRYPVKGLSPDPLLHAVLEPGKTLPLDRAYAIENGSRRFNSAAPVHMPKISFLVLMRDERLAGLKTRFDDECHRLSIFRSGKQVTSGCLNQQTGRQIIEQFFAAYMAKELRAAPHIVHAPGHSISDVREKCLSIINLASVADLGRIMGCKLDPLRFRANLYIEGLEPWAEMGWIDRDIAFASGAVLSVFKRTKRCAAVNVNPETGRRDLNIPQNLGRAFGHDDMGVYAMVKTGGAISPGDALELPA